MDRTERFYRIDQLLNTRRVVTTADLLDELGVSLATMKRDLSYLQTHLHAPIIYDREVGGYWLNIAQGNGAKYELPDLWFNESEVYALLVAKHLLEEIQPGMLEPYFKPLIGRLEGLLGTNDGFWVRPARSCYRIKSGRQSVIAAASSARFDRAVQ